VVLVSSYQILPFSNHLSYITIKIGTLKLTRLHTQKMSKLSLKSKQFFSSFSEAEEIVLRNLLRLLRIVQRKLSVVLRKLRILQRQLSIVLVRLGIVLRPIEGIGKGSSSFYRENGEELRHGIRSRRKRKKESTRLFV
jgi:hypothetical protein